MPMLPLLRNRRSVRRFKDRTIDEEKVEALLESLLRSPSSRNLNPWEFVVIDDRDLLERASRAKEHGSSFLARAALAVVVCADPARCDVWVEDCSIAAIILQLTAESLGLGSCWAQIRKRSHDGVKNAEEYLKDLLGLPEGYRVEAVVGIGYPDEVKAGHPSSSLQRGKLHRNRFGCAWQD